MKNYTKRILGIAIPIMLSNLISQLQMIDKMYLGRLDIRCMSAVGNATTPMWTTMSIIFALTTGATIIVSQAYGANETERAKSVMASVYKYNNVAAMILFLFWLFASRPVFQLMGVDPSIIDMSVTYAKIFSPIFILTGLGASICTMLQVSQKTTIMIAYGIVRSAANVALDYAMIFGHFGFPAMGVAGAAWATVIAELLGDAIIVIYVMGNKDLWLQPTFKAVMEAKLEPFVSAAKMGLPAAMEDFAWNLGNLYLIAMLNHVSIEAAGIHSIVFGIELMAVVIFGAFANATMTLSGYETGQGNPKGVWNVVMSSSALCILVSALNLLAFVAVPRQILGIFTSEENILLYAPIYLLIVGIDLFPKGGNMIFGSGIKGYGNPGWMLKTQLFGTAFIIIGSSIMVLGLHMGIAELFVLVVLDESLRFALNFAKLRSIKKTEEQKMIPVVE